MSIAFPKYVDITSGVEGSAGVVVRSLCLRSFTNSPLLPPLSYIEFDNSDDVGAYFGTASEEYARALFYFSFISKSVTQAQKISFARWVSAAVAPVIYGSKTPAALSVFNAITAGAFTLTMGAFTHAFTGITLASAGSFAAVATAIQTAIQAYSAGGALFTGATVAYDATRGSFQLTGGVAGAAALVVADGAQNVAAALGWVPQASGAGPGAIWGAGSAVQTVTAALQASADASDDFGSFLFQPALALADVQAAGTWNAGQNVKFQYSQRVLAADAAAWSAAAIGIAGMALTLDGGISGDYPDMDEPTILAAIDYDRRNASQNYMYQQFSQTPTVTTTTLSDTYDALRVNYYGQTQVGGQRIQFFQRGIMMGPDSAPLDMGTYGNEQWFKSYAGAKLMSLFLALPEIPANAQGRAQILAVLQGAIQQAIFNGTISPGKTLTPAQIIAITNATGDANAWRQVQNIGYWVDVVIAPYTGPDDTPEYKAVYTIVYSKNDAVRKIDGQHVLI